MQKTVDRVVDVPVVLQRQVRTTRTAQETVEVLQSQYRDRVVDVVVVILQQSSIIQKVTRTANTSKVPFAVRIVDVLVVIQRQVPTIQKTAIYNAKLLVATRRQSRDVATPGSPRSRDQRVMSSTQVQLIGFDAAMLTPH